MHTATAENMKRHRREQLFLLKNVTFLTDGNVHTLTAFLIDSPIHLGVSPAVGKQNA